MTSYNWLMNSCRKLRAEFMPVLVMTLRGNGKMALQQIEISVRGMDCAGCCSSVQKALIALPGVQQADVLLAAEKAVVQYDAAQVDIPTLHRAVEGAGYTVPVPIDTVASEPDAATHLAKTGNSFTRSVLLF